LPGSTVNSDMSVTLKKSNIGFINFSDSIVFYSRDDSDGCLDTILQVSGEFMNVVITGPSRMLRGAISHGEFYADPEANAYVGQALVDAYQLESAQDWLSCSLDGSVERLPQFRRALTKYPNFVVPALVPLPDSSRVPYCLNWADKCQFEHIVFDAERGLADCERRARRSLEGDPTELEKLSRRVSITREFIRHYNATEATDKYS
jgi:hypothetical protein